MTNRMTHTTENTLTAKLGAPKRLAVKATLAFAALFGAWSVLAPMSSATVATGMVSPDTGRKTIQHLEGGIIEKLLVNEGDTVDADQVIAILADSKARAAHDGQVRRRAELTAQLARLKALANLDETPDFSALSSAVADDPSFSAFVTNETALFKSRLASFNAKLGGLREEMRAIAATIGALDKQIESAKQQYALVNEQYKTKSELLTKGLTTKPIVLSLQSQLAQLDGQIAQYQGQKSAQEHALEQKKSNFENEAAAFRNEIADQAGKASTERSAIDAQLSASSDAVRRMEVRSPERGTIVSLKTRTPGAVIPPGGAIADLVPADKGAVIEVRVKPADIVRVEPGQQAQVMLTAYSQREMPTLPAKVQVVSADKVEDPATHEIYYKTELKLDADQVSKLAPNTRLVAGMPVEAYISHHERTLAQWLYEPVSRSFHRAAREY